LSGWNGEDICLWPDGTTCQRDDLEAYLSFMSDDFEIIPMDDPRYDIYFEEVVDE
jgi:hypothetical protein